MKAISNLFNMTSGAKQLLMIFGGVLFITHLVGCFWFLLAKESGYTPDTWVVRAGIQNEDI